MNLWSTARYDLHLTDDEFKHLTGRQLHALIQRHKQRLDRDNYLAGIIASTAANFSMCRPKEPLTADDFMLGGPRKKEETAAEFAERFAFQMSGISIGPGIDINTDLR